MKNKFMLVAASTILLTMSAPSLARSIAVTSDTLEAAEALIAEKARQLGAQYKITEANMRNRVHMTAKLY
ncbi:hypothetical protein J2X14_000927 [Pantoea alhagi]|uniref:DUF1471 domain-containing protein n=1 Tax=Mixta sp. BE291 TaxID=3158787 RepID=UPI0028650AE3|nr:hypothetical protein [Pantoea alhagi]